MSKIFTPEECEALEKQCREAIELLGRANTLLIQRTQGNKMLSDLVAAQDDCIVKLREKLKQLQEERRWIPVEERLPELDRAEDQSIIDGPWTEVLVMIDGASTATCLYFDGECFFDLQGDEAIPYRVTHWKPMPKGPEVGHD